MPYLPISSQARVTQFGCLLKVTHQGQHRTGAETGALLVNDLFVINYYLLFNDYNFVSFNSDN